VAAKAAGRGIAKVAKPMKSPKQFELLINVGGAIAGLSVIGYIAYAALHKDVEQQCSTRYPAATSFSLRNSEGKPLSAIALQARAGLRDLGVVDNASVVPLVGGPTDDVLEVKLRQLPAGADQEAVTRNGIEFRWSPPGMKPATAACLSYSVFLPDKFAFGSGGFLPGVFGGAGGGARSSAAGLLVSPEWETDGSPVIAATGAGSIGRVSANTSALPTGRWIRIEQEVVLNEPGKENGQTSLWIDGQLVLDSRRVLLRKDADETLSGVLVAAGYRSKPPEGSSLQLSPFEISWR